MRKSAVVVLLFFIVIHSILMNGYYSDPAHLTADTYFSSIRAHIDPDLFRNSIYVQAVERTKLRIGFLYDILPVITRYVDLEFFCLAQTVVSLLFVVFGLCFLTKTIFNSYAAGIVATLLYSKALNSWVLGSPEPYLDFFHHGLPYTYPLTIWSMFFWHKRKYPLAAFLAGIAWGFHTMGALFLLFGYALYVFFNSKEFSIRTILKTCLAFFLPAFPFMLRSFEHMESSSASGPLWLKGVEWVMFFTCIPSAWPIAWLARAGLFFVLAATCYFSIRNLAIRKWLSVFFLAVVLLCLVGTLFADYIPVDLIIKMSLWRSTTNYVFLALPCIAYGFIKIYERSVFHRFFVIFTGIIITGYVSNSGIVLIALSCGFMMCSLWVESDRCVPRKITRFIGPVFFSVVFVVLAYHSIRENKYTLLIVACGVVGVAVLDSMLPVLSNTKRAINVQRSILLIIFIVVLDVVLLTMNGGPKIFYKGKIQGVLDPWVDIQLYSREYSHKDDIFIVPPHLNGFTMYSHRAILGDWSEGTTLIYLDDKFTRDWFERMHDLGWTEQHMLPGLFDRLSEAQVVKVAKKYGARFIVTQKPKEFNFRRLYENDEYILFEVL